LRSDFTVASNAPILQIEFENLVRPGRDRLTQRSVAKHAANVSSTLLTAADIFAKRSCRRPWSFVAVENPNKYFTENRSRGTLVS
jgi:hypothetical protein